MKRRCVAAILGFVSTLVVRAASQESRTQTFVRGDTLYLERVMGKDSIRVGMSLPLGGAISVLSLNGRELVNHFDNGREIQVALYDANEIYDSCAGCTGVFGWDPVQGGDKYSHVPGVLDHALVGDTIYTKSRALEWYPDSKGGGPQQAVPSDVIIEQWVSPAGDQPAFRVRYRISHAGTDLHANGLQEIPAIYGNLGFDRLVYYDGGKPWTRGRLNIVPLPRSPESLQPYVRTPEHWQGLVDSAGIGFVVYVPLQYSYTRGRHVVGEPGPRGRGLNYIRPFIPFSFGPGSVLTVDTYLVVGESHQMRAAIYALHAQIAGSMPGDVLPPYGELDNPKGDSLVSGVVAVSGWVFDDDSVAGLTVKVDGQVVGTASLGRPRPDVDHMFPGLDPRAGFLLTFDTRRLGDGLHTIEIVARDRCGNLATFKRVRVRVAN